jgi:DME family drug/metabolite transporter
VTRLAARATLPYAAVALAACSWGAWALILRRAEAIHPMPVALESAIVLAVIMAGSGLAALRDRMANDASARRTFRSWACIAWFGVGDVLNMSLFFAAYRLTIAIAVLTHYMTPIFVALASPLVLREKIASRTAFAIALSFAGLAVMLEPSARGTASARAWTSAALGVGSAIFYASNVLVNKLVAASFTTSEAMFWHGVVATPLAVLMVPPSAWAGIDAHAASFLAVVAIGPGALAGLAFVWGLRRMPAAHASTLTLLEPLVAVCIGATLLGERVSGHTALGGTLILAGAVLVMVPRR